jgi:hypothetical protein
MPKQSRADLEAAYQATQRSEHILQAALDAVINKDVVVIGSFTETPRTASRYYVQLCAATAAHGGIVLITHRVSGQRASTRADYLDALLVETTNNPLNDWSRMIRPALDEAARLRERFLQARVLGMRATSKEVTRD